MKEIIIILMLVVAIVVLALSCKCGPGEHNQHQQAGTYLAIVGAVFAAFRSEQAIRKNRKD